MPIRQVCCGLINSPHSGVHNVLQPHMASGQGSLTSLNPPDPPLRSSGPLNNRQWEGTSLVAAVEATGSERRPTKPVTLFHFMSH